MPRISVGVRLRPDSSNQPKVDQLNINGEKNCLELSVSNTQHSFTFDQIFSDNSSQIDVFKQTTSRIVENALEGYNGCVFAYGQTGAGKTHTISGALEGKSDGYGICGQAAVHLFQKSKQSFDNITFRLSILEIYNETLVDLLVDLPSQNGIINAKNKLNIIETELGVMVPGLHILPIDTIDDCLTFLIEAQANRAVAEHQLNHASSRSHIIYTFYITRASSSSSSSSAGSSSTLSARHQSSLRKKSMGNNLEANEENNGVEDLIVHQSKLHIVDLAGSERANKTGSVGNLQKEANYINKSLSYLEQVVVALSQSNRDHIPYRQSKLTYLLKDSLGGNSNTYLIACIWPRKDHSWETLSTLRFAARMKSIETHPIRNRLVSKDPSNSNNGLVKQLSQQIDMLKKELALRDFLHQYDHWSTELSKQQILLTYKQGIDYVLQPSSATVPAVLPNGGNGMNSEIPGSDNPSCVYSIDPITIHSLSQVHLLCAFYKETMQELSQDNPDILQQAMKRVIEKRYMNSSSIHYQEKYSKLGRKLISLLSLPPSLSVPVSSSLQEDQNSPQVSTSLGEGLPSVTKTNNNSNNSSHREIAGGGNPSRQDKSSSNVHSIRNNIETDNPSREDGIAKEGGGGGDLPQVNSEYFQDFTQKTAAGKELHTAYEELKETLKNNKKRQKQIITLLNDQKYIIDELNIEINQYLTILQEQEEGKVTEEDREKDGTSQEGLEELQNTILDKKEKLDIAKKEYRTVHQELLLCKEQIQETQSLKKRAMNALLMAFNDYMTQLPVDSSVP